MKKMYITKSKMYTGANQTAMYRYARNMYRMIASKTKRKPYIRSAYFNKEKIFIDYFWSHIHTKNWNDRTRRLRFYECALELLRYTQVEPNIEKSANNGEVLYRFIGKCKTGEQFAVQVKEYIDKREKHFISVFPIS